VRHPGRVPHPGRGRDRPVISDSARSDRQSVIGCSRHRCSGHASTTPATPPRQSNAAPWPDHPVPSTGEG
jgi:hypothetical protein